MAMALASKQACEVIFSALPGANILTMDESNPSVQALAVKDGMIVAIGETSEVMKFKGPKTSVIKIRAPQTLMPGFIEPHSHPSLVSQSLGTNDISGFRYESYAQVKQAMEAALKKLDENPPPINQPWLIFNGWDVAMIPDLPELNANELDKLTIRYPVFVVSQSLHSAWTNHKALEVANITADTKDPDGGIIVRDNDGLPTGMLKEKGAIELFLPYFPKPEPSKMVSIFLTTLWEEYASNGFTTITDMGTMPLTPQMLAFLGSVTAMKECPIRLGVYSTPETKPMSTIANEKLWFPGVKVWADGSPYTGTMATETPYLDTRMTKALGFDRTNPRGILIYESSEKLTEKLQQFHDELIAVHAHGERAIDQVLQSYSKLIGKETFDHRYRIEHCGLITQDQISLAVKLGVTLTFYVDHLYYWGGALRDSIIGPERAERFAPVGLATKCGHQWTLHQDAPCTPTNPFLCMKTAITRKTKEGDVLGPKELCATIEDALKAYTINAAWQLKIDNKVGSLKVGKRADLVLLSQDPKVVKPEDLPLVKVLQTYLSGCSVEKPLV